MLAAHDAIATNSRKVQQKLRKLVYQRRPAAHAASLEEFLKTAPPAGPGDPTRWVESKPKPSPRLAIRTYRGREPRHNFARDQRTHPGSYTQKGFWTWEGGSLGLRNKWQ